MKTIKKPAAGKPRARKEVDGCFKTTSSLPICQALGRYTTALQLIPAPGAGCHPYLLSVANFGIFAGLEPEQIYNDIQRSIPTGGRRVPANEIRKTINKALRDHQCGTFTPRPRPKSVVRDGKAALQKIISQAKISDEVDLWESSFIRLLNDPIKDHILLLRTLFKSDDLIFIGDRHDQGIVGETIRTRDKWISYFKDGGKTFPFIIINPLTGTPAPTKGGDKETLRGDMCIKKFKFCLIEFDNLNREDQIKFWTAVKLPIVVLIDSAGKSIHAWIDVQRLSKIETPEQWQSEIKIRLYERILKPLGVDTTCSNPARLSRLPGHWRKKDAIQRILWLSFEGGSIC
jgi:hypothetical protein